MARPRVALAFPATILPNSFFGFVLPSLGLERLGAAAEDLADVELFDARFEGNFVRSIADFSPDFVAISAKTTMYSPKSYALADELRTLLPKAKLVMGGLHATSCPEEALEHVDYVIRGDGEISFHQLIEGRELSEIAGLVHRSDGKVVTNPLRDPVMNLDEFKPPARHLRKPHYHYRAAGLIEMDLLETSRGCTHACSFCSPGAVYPCKYRTHSPEYLIKEIETIYERGVRYCMLTDDHFGGDDERVEKICDLIIERDIRIAFFAFIRPFTGKMELKKKMVRAGFVFFSYGAESPAKSQLNRYGKGYPAAFEFIKQVNEEWLEAGAKYIGNSYVFGDVKDSRETLSELGVYARKLNPTFIEPLYSQPYPGTRYRDELNDEGLLLDRPWEDFTESRLLVRHPEVKSQEDMRQLRAKMWLDFFSPRKAAGIFRGPLYFHYHIGLPVLTILRYMKACDYLVFGCLLENKPYADKHIQMVYDYFHDHLPTFEEEEMCLDDMCQYFDKFADMISFRWLKRLLGEREVALTVYDGDKIVGSLLLAFSEGEIKQAKAFAGMAQSRKKGKVSFVNIPLGLLARAVGSKSEVAKIFYRLLIGTNIALFDIPRRILSFLL